MNNVKQSLWLLLTLLALAFSGWYFVHNQKVGQLDKDTLSSTVDTTISQLTVRKYNAEGQLINLLTTPVMQHIPKGDLHLIDKPHIVIAQLNQPDWEISSLKAKSFGGGEKITFMDKVIVHQKSGETSQESTLKTEEVTYFPKENKATTNLFVTFEQPGNFMQSTGMNAYLDEKRVELLHQARGSYEPKKG